MSLDDSSQKRVAAPYVSYQSFKGVVASLKEHVIPNRIDRSLIKNHSGSTQAQIMSALRFLMLIDKDDRPTDSLRNLVAAYETDEWPKALGAVLFGAYAPLFDLQLETASPYEFNETFRKAFSMDGETLRKGVTFFLNAGREAGIPFSPFLTKGGKPRSAPSGNGRRKTRPKAKEEPSATTTHTSTEPPNNAGENAVLGMLLKKFPDFDPSWSDDLKKQWFAGFEEFMKGAKGK